MMVGFSTSGSLQHGLVSRVTIAVRGYTLFFSGGGGGGAGVLVTLLRSIPIE